MHLNSNMFSSSRVATLVLSCILATALNCDAARGQSGAGRKRAVLVGINEYKHPNLKTLDFAENDVTEMAALLRSQGYQVTLVLGAKATKVEIEKKIAEVAGECERGDTVLIGLAGHGLQFLRQPDSFLVPVDGRPFPDEAKTLVSLNGVYDQLKKSFAGIKVLFVDACRDDPTTSRGIDADSAPRPPQGVAALFSCKAGERSFEHKDLKHGVFFHYVLEGLRGKAKDEDDEVTFASLTSYVSKNVSRNVPTLIQGGAKQSPTLKAEYSVEPILAKIDARSSTPPKPTVPAPTTPAPSGSPIAPPREGALFDGTKAGEEREFSDLKIKFCWCPAGKFTMGSPRSEVDRGDDEEPVEVTLTRGFWLGQTEVTQKSWETIMKTYPWLGSDSVDLGPTIPATFISQEDAISFCQKLNDREQAAGRLPRGVKYRLPTEAEWEYACRAGTTSAYYFGNDAAQLGDYAWFGALFGNGNTKNERYAHEVAKKKPNPWNLYDMHGNTWEWCADWHAAKLPGGRDPQGPATGTKRILRGGSWFAATWNARSAHRTAVEPTNRNDDRGFRLVLSAGD